MEERVAEAFPDVAIDVLDRDAARRIGGAAAVLERFANGRTRILVGTQMVAKGHHFPNVGLTAVLAADSYLGFPDFRAVERTYSMLTQLAGRAGRGERPGRVVIQTYFPEHYAIRAALAHDDAAFAEEEMRFRRVFHYPPYTRMVQLLVRGRDRAKTEARADQVSRSLHAHALAGELRISGPAPAPLERLQGQWRFQLLLRSASAARLRRLVGECVPRDRPRRRADRRRSAGPVLTTRRRRSPDRCASVVAVPAQGQNAAFDEPIEALRRRIEELEGFPEGSPSRRELEGLRKELRKTTGEVFRNLDAWQRTQVARHLDRPYTLDYVRGMMSDWVELHGDRAFGDDAAIVAGFATFRGRSVAVVGHEKGRGTNERIRRNFGQANPEGHRKALRVMRLAARFGKPVVSLIDTPGAYPGKRRRGARASGEHRRQPDRDGGAAGSDRRRHHRRGVERRSARDRRRRSRADARVRGALGDHARGLRRDPVARSGAQGGRRRGACASPLPTCCAWASIDEIIPEPVGGAQADHEETFRLVGDRLDATLRKLERRAADELVKARHDRYRAMGVFEER